MIAIPGENPTTSWEALMAEGGCFPGKNGRIMLHVAAKAVHKESSQMIHDVVLALVFLIMIIAPALLAMRADREEKNTF